MADIWDENYMLAVLQPCLPPEEKLLAAVKAITLQVNKKKTSFFDVYIGLTASYLLVIECEERCYLNDEYRIPDWRKTVAEDLGTCFALSEIQSCVVKKGIMGAINCALTMRDGGFIKLQIPKRAGLGGGMPNHLANREKIVACLQQY